MHGFGYGIASYKFIISKQSLKYGHGNNMLRKHFDGFLFRKIGINVFAQSLHQLFKSFFVLAFVGNQFLYTFNVLFCNLGNVPCPQFPVTFTAYLFHHLGIKHILQIFKLEGKLLCHLFGSTFLALFFSFSQTIIYAVIIVGDTAKQDMLGTFL